ncbi:Sec-independent protein translocase protein TatB [Suttonella sp. R2A3]|uniref:Sec-independent protein translocase protein TatB n=1 Tax=Suttonella sp. R2A3 TaxID=2908648 RepID=UPI001F321323|nr:Sec-independent protein translocase protein TatB [Suttonella sp. R2A3]UJF23995.1 Sec-independent protein translocase protein TatB [Suttonella sp. R2A3]
MFDIGFWELATIAIIGIVVVGPDRLPEVVRTIAIYLRKLRRTFHNVKSDIEHELDLDNLRSQIHDLDVEDHIKKLNQSVMDMDREVRDEFDALDAELRDTQSPSHNADEFADTGVEELPERMRAKPATAEEDSKDSPE